MIIERGNRYFSYSLPSRWFEARHFADEVAARHFADEVAARHFADEVAVNIDFRGLHRFFSNLIA
jgi:hypothetical protein